MNRTYVRCSYCQMRRTLARHPEEYARVPRCRGVGCAARQRRERLPARYYVDRYRMRIERGTGAPRPCCCTAYHFPHRRGSLYCDFNPKLTADDLRERTERGSQ